MTARSSTFQETCHSPSTLSSSSTTRPLRTSLKSLVGFLQGRRLSIVEDARYARVDEPMVVLVFPCENEDCHGDPPGRRTSRQGYATRGKRRLKRR